LGLESEIEMVDWDVYDRIEETKRSSQCKKARVKMGGYFMYLSGRDIRIMRQA
jgi:hypothetical protein